MQGKKEGKEKDAEERQGERHEERQRVLKAIKAGEALLEEVEEAIKEMQGALSSSQEGNKTVDRAVKRVAEKARSYLLDAHAFVNKADYLSAIAAADYAFGLLEGMCRVLAVLVERAGVCEKLKGYGELE